MLRVLIVALLLFAPAAAFADDPIALGNRLELLADDFLIDATKGDIDFKGHQPEPAEVVFTADAAWEGNTSGYYGVFADGDIFRMIYRGWQNDPILHKAVRPERTCLAVSDDGIHWRKPDLGLFEFDGSTDNNIIWEGPGRHNFTAFKDENPNCAPDARYKALGSVKGGLGYFKSPDGVHWEVAADGPILTEGKFDSQNAAFWDAHEKQYRVYWRIFPNRVRSIRTATSPDFINWQPHADLTYPEGTPVEHLYTNAVQKYFRAPHIFIGFPTRIMIHEGKRTEPIFMISRDGVEFRRYNEAVISETAPADRQGNRSNYMTLGMLSLPGSPDEISVYATEAYYGSVPGRVRRFVFRLDGFASLRAGASGGEIVTKPLTFDGAALVLNYAASDGGDVQVELQDANGTAIDGFTADDSVTLDGDSVRATVGWKNGSDVSNLAGKTIRIRLIAKNADVYSLRFE